MTAKLTSGITCVLALGLAACSGGSGDNVDAYTPPVPQPDGGGPAIDTAPTPIDTAPAYDPFVWVVIQDTEQKACTTNGPGSDIDAVALWDLATSTPLGWGKIGSATFTPNPAGNACENADCSGGNCKYAYIGTGTTFNTLNPPDVRVAFTEGLADAKVSATADDSGYFSLNAGTLQIEIGDLNGVGVPQQLKTNDIIKVFEVDQSYKASGSAPATCTCLPEHYTVMLQSLSGKELVTLKPLVLDANNAAICGAIAPTTTDGCGSTVFVVP